MSERLAWRSSTYSPAGARAGPSVGYASTVLHDTKIQPVLAYDQPANQEPIIEAWHAGALHHTPNLHDYHQPFTFRPMPSNPVRVFCLV